MGQGKVKEITHDLNHDLIFYCIHNQLFGFYANLFWFVDIEVRKKLVQVHFVFLCTGRRLKFYSFYMPFYQKQYFEAVNNI